MSRVEAVAALAPGVFPLLVQRTEHFDDTDLAHGELCVEVPPLSPQEAKALLRLKLKGSASSFDVSSTTERLLDVLGYIPLAITQAAAFINRNRWTLQGYLAALEKDKQNLTDYLSQELQDPRRPRGFPNSVFRTWKLSFDNILAQEPKAATLLSLIAMLDSQRIPEKLLRLLAEREVDFRMAISTLDGFALISQEIGGETYTIHPLVQASVHYWLEQSSEKADYAGPALQLCVHAATLVIGAGWNEGGMWLLHFAAIHGPVCSQAMSLDREDPFLSSDSGTGRVGTPLILWVRLWKATHPEIVYQLKGCMNFEGEQAQNVCKLEGYTN